MLNGSVPSGTLATELLNSRQRSGQRGYVDVEPPADTRPDVHQILGANVPAPGALASIPEEADSMDTAVPQTADTASETRQSAGGVLQAADGATVPPEGTPSEAPTSTSSPPFSYPWTSASNYITVLPGENECDSKVQTVVHGSFDAIPEQDPTTFEASEGMAMFDDETRSYWVSPGLRTELEWCTMSNRMRTRRNLMLHDSRKSTSG